MTIYFAQMGDWIKIGFTANKDATKRIAQLQTGQPQRIKLLGTISGDMEAEAGLHREYAEFHENGEWFRCDPELMSSVQFLIDGQKPWYFSRLRLRIVQMWRDAFTVKGVADESAYEDFAVSRSRVDNHPYVMAWTKPIGNEQSNQVHDRNASLSDLRRTVEGLMKRISALSKDRREMLSQLEFVGGSRPNPFGY